MMSLRAGKGRSQLCAMAIAPWRTERAFLNSGQNEEKRESSKKLRAPETGRNRWTHPSGSPPEQSRKPQKCSLRLSAEVDVRSRVGTCNVLVAVGSTRPCRKIHEPRIQNGKNGR